MESRTVSSSKALELQALLSAAKAVKLQAGSPYHKLEAEGNILLVDPVNGDPFVFVAPATVHVFPFKLGSGTDHLRQRIKADQLFQQLSHSA